MFGFRYYDSSMLLLLPTLILSLYAQFRVSVAFATGKNILNSRGLTGLDVARSLLDSAGLYQVRVESVSSGDHFDPRANVVRLTPGVLQGRDVTALAVAAHEVGHAVQHQQNYAPLGFRTAFFPVARIGSSMAWPLLLVGFMFEWSTLVTLGILLFTAAVLFQVVTLPIEFDASRRAVDMLTGGGYIVASEEPHIRNVLNAAALTYIAATLTALAQLLRLLMISNSRRSRK